MFKKLIEVSATASLLRAGIFTAGHFCIDVFVIALITGAAIETATVASLVGPVVNGLWFLIIDRVWSSMHAEDEAQHPAKFDEARFS